jgi:hypothetical protein
MRDATEESHGRDRPLNECTPVFQSRSVRLDVAPRDRPFDLLVQRSLLELFESYGVAAAPKPITTQELPELPDLAGMARFTANGVRAAILVSMPRAVLARTARSPTGCASSPIS